jgi:uncharacterized protein (DUF1778 family)
MAQNPTSAAHRRPAKDGRIALRASASERKLIEAASALSATSVSAFMLAASLERARELLADRREFRLPPDRWNAFVALLDEERTDDRPELRRLLTEPSVLEP